MKYLVHAILIFTSITGCAPKQANQDFAIPKEIVDLGALITEFHTIDSL